MGAAAITKQELFARLAEGHAARVSVVTPNRRLAQELARQFDEGRIAAGLTVWETADILPFAAFAERLYEDALYSEAVDRLPLLLTAAQEASLWGETIGESEWAGALLATAPTAERCADAWRLAHAWRIAGALGKFPGNDDARAFAEWAVAYEKRTEDEGCTDAARLADIVAGLLTHDALRKPKLLVAYGFDILAPQTLDFLDACANAGMEVRACSPLRRDTQPVRLALSSPREELAAAARWARARLEAGAGRIGVVVPDLEKRRKEAVRVFSRTLRPGYNLPGAKAEPMPFNVSLGTPLSDTPLVHAALGILELAAGEVEFALASRLVRSPFLGAAESEMAARARLDARLRERLPARLTLARLRAALTPGPSPASGRGEDLVQRLEALIGYARENLSGPQSPHDWGRHFSALLEAAGFPGERTLDSTEFQARAKFHEMLREFARLERVVPRLTYAQALARLKRLCAGTLFQPETGDAPIQVLGILESAGLEFDCLWVSGLTDEAWPLHARPNPFLPVALQKKAGVPEASAESSLALDRRITEGWAGAAAEVVFSWPEKEEDRDLAASPLISILPIGRIELPQYPRYRDLIFAARAIETVPNGIAPPLSPVPSPPSPLPLTGEGKGERGIPVRGGTRILADQAACPFRAFARHRLGAQALETPAAGVDAKTRGLLLHTLMAQLWGELKTRAALDALPAGAIERAADAAVREAKLEGRFADLERERLAKLAREWLDVERERGEFEVIAREDKRTLEVAGLELTGRIDRLDRLGDGTHVLIDYKTGRATPKDWLGPRPNEPQLPLYALNAPEDIAAVAYASLRTGEMKFMGLAREKGLVPNLKPALDWATLVSGWKDEIEALGRGFAAGDARVDPKELLKTCRNCDLQPLCRVYERLSPLSSEGRGEEE